MNYYIHDKTRGCVGTSMIWWRWGHHGYTCDIDEAHVFTEKEIKERLQADDLVAYRVDYIKSKAVSHVDRHAIDQERGVTGASLEEQT